MRTDPPTPNSARRLLVGLVALGIYITLEGYHSRDGDQAYRLPLLARFQDPRAFAGDPFVNAVAEFHPHRGYLALLDWASRPFGLSAALFGLFAITFLLAFHGFDRLARALWPDKGRIVGGVAFALLLACKSGNLGDNPLFEPLLLDRQIAFALGWSALAMAVEGRKGVVSALLLGSATFAHPALGVQLAMLWASGWLVWSIRPKSTGVRLADSARAITFCLVGLAPALVFHERLFRSDLMFAGLSRADYLTIAARIQNPQHLSPDLWRFEQAVSWVCLIGLGMFAGAKLDRPERLRWASLLGILTVGLGLSWAAIVVFRDPRATLFQPFRLATAARGLALAALSGRVVELWNRGGFDARVRAGSLCLAWTGDLASIAATGFEAASTLADKTRSRSIRLFAWLLFFAGNAWLAKRDTASGHVPLLLALIVGVLSEAGRRLARVRRSSWGWSWGWNRRRAAFSLGAAWLFPAFGALATFFCLGDRARPSPIALAAATRWRFGEVPKDDIERLAVWCRGHTEADGRFVTPPGPKTFRLWSRRAVAFNRASSPYHAAGLADWTARFRDHVGFTGSLSEFARAYLRDRHALERGYDRLDDLALAALANRQGASYLISEKLDRRGPLKRLRVEGRYALYRVDKSPIATGGRFAPRGMVR